MGRWYSVTARRAGALPAGAAALELRDDKRTVCPREDTRFSPAPSRYAPCSTSSMLLLLGRPRTCLGSVARNLLVALLAAQVGACATTHEFAASAVPAVGPVSRGAAVPQRRTIVYDREGNPVPFRPTSRMVLHLATATRRRVHLETQPRELHVVPYGVWVRNSFVPASAVLGFEAVDPKQGQTITAAIVLPIVSVFAGFLLLVALAGAPVMGDDRA